MSFRIRDSFLEVGLVPDAGEPTYTPIRVADLALKATIATSANNENRATTNAAADEAEEGYAQATFKRRLRGSGVVGTPPAEDPLLRAAQLRVTDVTGAAGTVATYTNLASTPTLAWAADPGTVLCAGAVLTISAGTGAGQRRTVSSWDADAHAAVLAAPFDTAPDGTSRYSILRQRVYTASPEAVERIAARRWARNAALPAKSKRSDLSGGMATFQASVTPGKAVELSWTIRGILPGKPVEAAFPDTIAWAAQAAVAPKMLLADLWFGGRSASRMYSLTIDHAATLDQGPDVAQAFGYDVADATEHKTGGQFVYEMAALSDDDPMAAFLGGTPKWLMLILGEPGNGFAVTGEATVTGHDESNQRSRIANQVTYRLAGEDAWYHIAAF